MDEGEEIDEASGLFFEKEKKNDSRGFLFFTSPPFLNNKKGIYSLEKKGGLYKYPLTNQVSYYITQANISYRCEGSWGAA